MIKTVEVIVIIALIIISFFLGVKYSSSVKSHMSWLETQDEQEVELPDLSDESINDGSAPAEVSDPNAAMIENTESEVASDPNVPANNNYAPDANAGSNNAPQAPSNSVQAVPVNR